MRLLEEPQYYIMKFFMMYIGLWPYESRKLAMVKQMFAVGLIISIAIPQISAMIESLGKNYDISIQCIPPVLHLCITLAKYINVVVKMEKIKTMFASIKNDWDRMKEQPEQQLLREYAMEGRQHAMNFTICIAVSGSMYMLLMTVTVVHDNLRDRNGTEPRQLLYELQYFIDQEKYYYLLNLHAYILSLWTVILLVAGDVIYIILIQHACVLYSITGYRLKTVHVLGVNTVCTGEDIMNASNRNFSKREHEQIFQKFKLCIREHNRALDFVDHLQDTFSVTLFCQIAANVICISATGVMILIRSNSTETALRLALWLSGQVIHLFGICLPGQRLTNFSENLYYDALGCMWYICDLKTRILYQFFIMNTITPRYLVALKLTTMSMDTFQSVIRVAASYFTLLSSSL